MASRTDEVQSPTAHAAALGRLGGQARAARLSRKRRHEIAKKAAAMRWGATGRPSSRPSPEGAREAILEVVLDVLEGDSFHAVRLREVARRARVSLATIYHFFPTRDELIVSAVERWMNTQIFVEPAPPSANASLYEILMEPTRDRFERWLEHPHMLEAFYRARQLRGGARLAVQGNVQFGRLKRRLLRYADSAYADDVVEVMRNVVYGLMARFAEGQIAVTEILPVVERTVVRLTKFEVGVPREGP